MINELPILSRYYQCFDKNYPRKIIRLEMWTLCAQDMFFQLDEWLSHLQIRISITRVFFAQNNQGSSSTSIVEKIKTYKNISKMSASEIDQDETIISIEPFSLGGFDGYNVITTEQVISLGIENTDLCCENFGSKLHLPDKRDVVDFVDVIVTKAPRWSTKNEEGSAMIEIETELGMIKIEVFNHHNGYYSHGICASWKGYSDKQEL